MTLCNHKSFIFFMCMPSSDKISMKIFNNIKSLNLLKLNSLQKDKTPLSSVKYLTFREKGFFIDVQIEYLYKII